MYSNEIGLVKDVKKSVNPLMTKNTFQFDDPYINKLPNQTIWDASFTLIENEEQNEKVCLVINRLTGLNNKKGDSN